MLCPKCRKPAKSRLAFYWDPAMRKFPCARCKTPLRGSLPMIALDTVAWILAVAAAFAGVHFLAALLRERSAFVTACSGFLPLAFVLLWAGRIREKRTGFVEVRPPKGAGAD